MPKPMKLVEDRTWVPDMRALALLHWCSGFRLHRHCFHYDRWFILFLLDRCEVERSPFGRFMEDSKLEGLLGMINAKPQAQDQIGLWAWTWPI